MLVCEAACKAAPDDADVIAPTVWARFQANPASAKALTVELDDVLLVHEGHVAARLLPGDVAQTDQRSDGLCAIWRRCWSSRPATPRRRASCAALAPKQAKPERPSLFGRLFKR